MAEHVQLAGPDADSTRPPGPLGRVWSRGGPRPPPRRAAGLPLREPAAHAPRRRPAVPPTARGFTPGRSRQCSYLTPLLRKPRSVRPAAPGAPTSCAGTWPSRPQSSERLRTGTVMAATPGFQTEDLPPVARVLTAAGRAPPPPSPAGEQAPLAAGSGASCRGGARGQAHGRRAGPGVKLRSGLGAGLEGFRDSLGA